jgi:hypothetical protein
MYTVEKYYHSKTVAHHLINRIVQINKFESYLEIGVFKGDTIRNVLVSRKDGVDPGFEGHMSEFVNYRMTSDDFFKITPKELKYDIIFIDGLHHSCQVDKDINNSLDHLNFGGCILLHDCNPPNEELQSVPRKTALWNGDVWKSVVKLRCSDPNLDISVVDTDWGIGIIRRGSQVTYKKASMDACLQWSYFEKNREELLNMISVDEFHLKYGKY